MNKKVTAIILVVVMVLSFSLPVSAAPLNQLSAAKSLLRWAGYTAAEAQEAGGWPALIEQTELVPEGYTFSPNEPCSNDMFEAMRKRACVRRDIKHGVIPVPTEPEVTDPEVTEPDVTEPDVTDPETTEPEVPETSKPAGSGDSADTGDSFSALWIFAMTISLMGAAALLVIGKKRLF